MKTADLKGAMLARAVALSIGLEHVMRGEWPAIETEFDPETHCNESSMEEWKCWLYFKPHEDWAQGGPLIDKYLIDINQNRARRPDLMCQSIMNSADKSMPFQRTGSFGPTPLVAAMRALVASVYGETLPGEIT